MRLITIVGPNINRVLRFTDAEQDIILAGASGDTITYKSEPGCIASGISYSNDGTVANCEILVSSYAGGQLQPADGVFGIYDGAAMLVELVDPQNPNASIVSDWLLTTGFWDDSGFWRDEAVWHDTPPPIGGGIVLLRGYVGQVKEVREGLVSFECRSVLTRARSVVTERFGPMCRADFGDDRCKIEAYPADIQRNTDYVLAIGTSGTRDYDTVNSAWGRVRIGTAGTPSDYQNFVWQCTQAGTTASSAPVYSGPVGTVIADGTAKFTCVNAWARYGQIDSVVDAHNIFLTALPDPRASVDGFYTLGAVIIRSGVNAGFSLPISNWIAASNEVRFFLDISEIIVGGELIEILPGCDKTEAMCFGRYNNIINAREEKFVPGRDLLLSQAGTATAPASRSTTTPISGFS